MGMMINVRKTMSGYTEVTVLEGSAYIEFGLLNPNESEAFVQHLLRVIYQYIRSRV